MERTQIYFPKSQIDTLKRIARQRRTTLSELVRDAVEVHYDVKKSAPRLEKEETLLEFAARIRKMGFKAPKDLASNLDEYLYGGKK